MILTFLLLFKHPIILPLALLGRFKEGTARRITQAVIIKLFAIVNHLKNLMTKKSQLCFVFAQTFFYLVYIFILMWQTFHGYQMKASQSGSSKKYLKFCSISSLSKRIELNEPISYIPLFVSVAKSDLTFIKEDIFNCCY